MDLFTKLVHVSSAFKVVQVKSPNFDSDFLQSRFSYKEKKLLLLGFLVFNFSCTSPSFMEPLKGEDFARKLIFIVKKIREHKKYDDTFIDKFLASVNNELKLVNRHDATHTMPDLSEWMSETLQAWRNTNPSTSETIFVCKFLGILAQYQQGFLALQNGNTLNELSSVLQSYLLEKKDLRPAYIEFLADLLSHTPGYEWIKNTQQWKVVSNLYFSNSNLYVEREGLHFLKRFINKALFDSDEVCEEIFEEIFLPIRKCNQTNIEDKDFYPVVLLVLRFLQSLLKVNIFVKSPSCQKLIKDFNLQAFLNFLLENSNQEMILDEASALQVLLFVVQYEDKKELLTMGDVPVLDTFYVMLKREQFNGIIKLAKYCQVLWYEIRKEINCESKGSVHFIIIQLLPALIITKPPDTALCDMYIQKLFSLTTSTGQKFYYLLRDEIRHKVGPKPKSLALRGVLSVISKTEYLNLEEAVIIFQAMAYTLKSFIPDNVWQSDRFSYPSAFCIQDTPLLSAVLNALCAFIEKFKINWSESLESLCLLKMTCILLQNVDLSSVVMVQVFLLVKVVILNFLSPDLALLINNTKDSSFDFLMPLLYKRLYDPNWEIRDSCLEIITAIAELSESKYPAFQQLLVEKDFCSLIVDIMEGDSESYVRASAIQALSAMTKIDALNQILSGQDFPRKIIKLLQNESEGIVRREAALVIKQIYLSLNDPNEEMVTSFYEVMGYLALSDLHWEVKINSLIFWEAVIQHIIADQSMIDGSFPKVTFSKEHKKIVNLTKDEIKLRLDKVLRKLSEIGCLHVLLSALNDDWDLPVIKKSAQILSDLLSILKRYGVIESCKDSICDRVPMKRKNTVLDNGEKRKTPGSRRNSSDVTGEKTSEFTSEESMCSDAVIDSIVNDMDINLLVSVCSQEQKTTNFQKKVLLQEIKPEAFLLQMQDFELEKFLEDKQKWLINVELDMKSFMNETCMADVIGETNIMDCY